MNKAVTTETKTEIRWPPQQEREGRIADLRAIAPHNQVGRPEREEPFRCEHGSRIAGT